MCVSFLAIALHFVVGFCQGPSQTTPILPGENFVASNNGLGIILSSPYATTVNILNNMCMCDL